MIKLVAIDLDDTLLDNSLQVSPRTRTAIRAAVARQVTVTVATGRMYRSALPYARQLGLDVPLITYNGALIKSSLSGETLLHRPLDEKIALELLAACRGQDWSIHVYLNDELYVRERDANVQAYERLAGVRAVPVGDALYTLSGAPTKLLLITAPAALPAIQVRLEGQFAGRLELVVSKPGFLEIVRGGVDKGRALDFLAGSLGIERAEVMAIGDSANDIAMLAYAGWGVAMGNADHAVQSKANAVTVANDADGVAEAIEKYVLLSSGPQIN